MTVRVYRSTDGSAPASSRSAGALITLLDAVLVNGYGAKSAAGWTKPYTGTNLAMYTQGSGSSGTTIYVADNQADFATIYGVVGPTSISSTPNQFGPLSSNFINKPSSAWVMIADQTAFYLFTRRPEYGACWGGMFFGDINSFVSGDVGRCLIAPSAQSTTTIPQNEPLCRTATYGVAVTSHQMAGMHNGLGSAVGVGKAESAMVTNNLRAPYQMNGGFSIRRPLINVSSSAYGETIPRGYMPGLWFYNHPQGFVYVPDGATFTPSGRLSGKTLENFLMYDQSSSPVYQNILIETSDTWGL